MDDENYVRLAIEEARGSFEDGEINGIGSVIVKDGEIIGKGHNNTKKSIDPRAHAETNAIREATKRLGVRDLTGSVLYTTCEPCPMCFGASWWTKISKIVYGASIHEMMDRGRRQINVKCEHLNDNTTENKIEIVGGVLKDECLELLRGEK